MRTEQNPGIICSDPAIHTSHKFRTDREPVQDEGDKVQKGRQAEATDDLYFGNLPFGSSTRLCSWTSSFLRTVEVSLRTSLKDKGRPYRLHRRSSHLFTCSSQPFSAFPTLG